MSHEAPRVTPKFLGIYSTSPIRRRDVALAVDEARRLLAPLKVGDDHGPTMTRALARDGQTNLARVLALYMPLSILRDFSHARGCSPRRRERDGDVSDDIRFDSQDTSSSESLSLSLFFFFQRDARDPRHAVGSDKADVVLVFLAYTSRRNTPRDFDVAIGNVR